MFKKLFALTAVVAVLSITTSCAQMQQSRLEQDYGTSARHAKSNQILNPDADKNLEPVYGLSGNAAQENMKKYEKNFERPAKEPVYTFSVGGGSK
jgi:hypothetical protein